MASEPKSKLVSILFDKKIIRTTKYPAVIGGIFFFFIIYFVFFSFIRIFAVKFRIMVMKKVLFAAAVTALVLVLAACSEKKKSDDIIAERVIEVKPSGPVKMQEYDDSRDVEWIGKTYRVSVHRQPCDSLPKVKDETGQEFVDNVFKVTVSRSDGSVFFSRTFTKPFFAQYVTEDFRKTGILEGIVFDKADGDWLVFAASVGHPQTDEYIPLVMRLSRMGNLDVKQDTQLDTNSNEEGEIEEGDKRDEE